MYSVVDVFLSCSSIPVKAVDVKSAEVFHEDPRFLKFYFHVRMCSVFVITEKLVLIMFDKMQSKVLNKLLKNILKNVLNVVLIMMISN